MVGWSDNRRIHARHADACQKRRKNSVFQWTEWSYFNPWSEVQKRFVEALFLQNLKT